VTVHRCGRRDPPAAPSRFFQTQRSCAAERQRCDERISQGAVVRTVPERTTPSATFQASELQAERSSTAPFRRFRECAGKS